MWKKKIVWKNDAIEFTFQDQVLSLAESIKDDELSFKATMNNGIQIKEVDLKVILKTVSDENYNPAKAVMWKKKIVWKNDTVEFTFQDQVVSLEESIKDDELSFEATMKNRNNQIKEVNLKVTLKTVSEENNNPDKAEKQEFHEQGSSLGPVKLEEENELADASRKNKVKENVADAMDAKEPDAKKKRESALEVAPKTQATIVTIGAIGSALKIEGTIGIQNLGNNTVTIKDGQLIVQSLNQAEASAISRKLDAGAISTMDSAITVDGIKKKARGFMKLGNNTVTIKDGQLIVQGPHQAEANVIIKGLAAGKTVLGTLDGKQVLVMLEDKVT